MSCCDCGVGYDDDKYIDNVSEIEMYNFFDSIEMAIWVYDYKVPTGYKWYAKCDKEMDKMIKELS